MFPRPSRVTRLTIVAAAVMSSLAFVYVLTPPLAVSVRGVGLEPTRSIATTPVSKLTIVENFTRKIAKGNVKDTYQAYKAALSEPFHPVNPHDFRYIHNPSEICHGRKRGNQREAENSRVYMNGTGMPGGDFAPVSLLVYIHSAPGNLKKRQAVRQTWAHPTLLRRLDAAVVFLLGRPAMAREQALLDLEANEYGDLVQEDFLDAYRNLTYKGVSALRWVSLFCPSAVFLLKTDDDILVDIVSLVADLRKRYPGYPPSSSEIHGVGAPNSQLSQVRPSRVVLCNLWTRMKVMRDPKSKWFIPPSEFGPDYFPPYCSGSAFVLSADLAPRLYQVSLDKPFFWVDDYYITGVLVNSLGVPHVRYNDVYLLNANLAENQLANDTGKTLFFHVKKLALFLKLWPMLLRRHLDIPDLKDLMPKAHSTPSSIVGVAPAKQYGPGPRNKHYGTTVVFHQTAKSTGEHIAPIKKEGIPLMVKYPHSNTLYVTKNISRNQNSAHNVSSIAVNKSENSNALRKPNEDLSKHDVDSSDFHLHQILVPGGIKSLDPVKKTLSVPSTKQKQYVTPKKLGSIFTHRRRMFFIEPGSSKFRSHDDQMKVDIFRGLAR